jgi:hypothetical protein
MQRESGKLGGPGRLVARALLSLFIIGLAGFAVPAQTTKLRKATFDKNSPFYFVGAILRQTLENYLDRSITMGYFLFPGSREVAALVSLIRLGCRRCGKLQSFFSRRLLPKHSFARYRSR